MNYEGVSFVLKSETPHLGGNMLEGDPFTYCPNVWDYAISRFAIQSVLDLGSGRGFSSDYFFKKGLKVLAVDGLRDNVERSVFPALMHDLSTGPILTRVDLVHCHEVVEHIDEEYLENLLASLACGKYLLMTHALPGQGGHHHVNLQPPEYWINHLSRYGLVMLGEDSQRIRRLAKKECSVYMAATGMLFANRNQL